MINPFQIRVPEGVDISDIAPRTPAQSVNDMEGDLNRRDGIDCRLCRNKGYIAVDLPDGTFAVRDCECRERRRVLHQLRASGLTDLVKLYSFKNFTTPDAWTVKVKKAAGSYVNAEGAPWFSISGAPGTGKTHICTAICRRFLNKGAAVRYMLWREEAPILKALVNEPEYETRFRDWAGAEFLYVDDFLKGKVTEGDLNLAFALINARYNARSRRTVISSELSLADVSRLDPALSSRIYERAKGYILMAPPGAANFREKGEKEENA